MATYESDKIIIGTKIDACGTTSRTVGDKIIYENQLEMKGQHNGLISRQPDMFIKVTCMFPASAFAQSRGHGLANEVNATERKFKNPYVQLSYSVLALFIYTFFIRKKFIRK